MGQQMDQNVQHKKKDSEKFLLKEYESLRSEMEGEIEELRTIFKYTIVFSGLIWSWILSKGLTENFHFLKWIPFFISTLFYLQYLSQLHDLFYIGNYLKKVESYFELPAGLGWEHRENKLSKAMIIIVSSIYLDYFNRLEFNRRTICFYMKFSYLKS